MRFAGFRGIAAEGLALALTLTVNTDDPLLFVTSETWGGLNWQLIPLGGLSQANDTLPLKPLIGLTVTLNVCELPTGIVAEVGATDPLKLCPVKPYTSTSVKVPTYTFPLTIVGTANLTALPARSRLFAAWLLFHSSVDVFAASSA